MSDSGQPSPADIAALMAQLGAASKVTKKSKVEDKYGLISNDIPELDPNDPLVKMLDGMLKQEEEAKKPAEQEQSNLLKKIDALNT